MRDIPYEIHLQEAEIVRQIYHWYTEDHDAIAGVVRKLNAQKVPTKSAKATWERTTIWGMLKNPAYMGKACFGKTRTTGDPAKRTKKQRERGGPSPRAKHHEDVPRDQWIEIDVPAIIDEKTFAWAQERLQENRERSKRRTIEPSLLQSLLVCKECGHALYRTSTKTSAGKKIYYYRCIGSDNYRFEKGRICQSKPMRVDMLDELVWDHLIGLLGTPKLVKEEIEKRKQASRESKMNRSCQKTLSGKINRTEKQMNRLLDAYQQELLTLDDLRQRTLPLQSQLKMARTELAKAKAAVIDEKCLETLGQEVNGFLSCLQNRAQVISVEEKQKIVRLLIEEVIVSGEIIKVHHSIPLAKKKLTRPAENCLLGTRSQGVSLRHSLVCGLKAPVSQNHSCFEILEDQFQDSWIGDAFAELLHEFLMIDGVEEGLQIAINNVALFAFWKSFFVHLLGWHDARSVRVETRGNGR